MDADLWVTIMDAKTRKNYLTRKTKMKWKQQGFEMFTMICVVCGVEKQRTPEYFTPSPFYLNNWDLVPCGEEKLGNTKGQPCRACQCILVSNRRNTMRGFITTKLYTARARQKAEWKNEPFTLTPVFIRAMYENQQRRCVKTGVPMVLAANHNFRMSIDRIDNKKGYVRDNVQLVIIEANTPGKESTCGQTTKDDYVRVFESLKAWICNRVLAPTKSADFTASWNNTLCDNGVTAPSDSDEYARQIQNLHLPGILSSMAQSHNGSDLKKNRPSPRLTKEDLFLVLKQHDFRCCHSGVPLDFRIDSRFRVSFDKLDLTKSHSPDNIVPVCRFLNCTDHSNDPNASINRTENGDGMSRRKLAQMLLLTDIMQMTNEERAKVEAWLENNKTSLKRPREDEDDE